MARHRNETWCINLMVHFGHPTLINTGSLYKLANFFVSGGEGGIRTLGALLELGALAKLCFRPLSHLTQPRPKRRNIRGFTENVKRRMGSMFSSLQDTACEGC